MKHSLRIVNEPYRIDTSVTLTITGLSGGPVLVDGVQAEPKGVLQGTTAELPKGKEAGGF